MRVPIGALVLAFACAGCGRDIDVQVNVGNNAPAPSREVFAAADTVARPLLPSVPPVPGDPPAPEPLPVDDAERCDPNYDPCVPVARDVDCLGGRGDGPAYVRGPVRVIGRDVYALDRDRDGIGCE